MNARRQALIVVPSVICVLASAFGVVGYFLGIAVGLPTRCSMPPLLRGFGVVVLGLGFLFLGWLFRYRKPGEVITSTYVSMRNAVKGPRTDETCSRTEPLVLLGPQRHVRHPMYFAVVVLPPCQ